MKKWLILIFLISLIFVSGCFETENKLKENSSENAPPLKIFGKSEIVSVVSNITNQQAHITIEEIINYRFLESKEQLVNTGDKIIIHFTGIGNEDEWKTKLLSVNTVFSTRIRCLDGRINSREPFTKEKCFWESNEEDIIIK